MMYWYGSCTGGMNSVGGLQCAKKKASDFHLHTKTITKKENERRVCIRMHNL